MSQQEKLLKKFLAKPILKDLTFRELEALLKSFGYEKKEGSGSRVKFYREKTQDLILLHKPHPRDILKSYVIRQIQEKLLPLIYE